MKAEFKNIVLASNNLGKLAEFNEILQPKGFHAIPQQEFNVREVEETGLTFIENALLKAREAAKISKLPALADDSGLCVDALGGQPGIYSARYAGVQATPAEKIALLLKNLENTPAEKRTARFVCVLVLMRSADDPLPIIAQGIWEAVIVDAPRVKMALVMILWSPFPNCIIKPSPN
jgi:XTP/dITP diphosphohydrolase